MNVQMNVDPIVFIKETAKAIQERKIKPYVIIENPHKILSGETKKILINKRGLGIQVGEEIVDLMIKYGSKIKKDELKGIRICRQALAKWEEDFDERKDPNGKPYFWLTGKFVNYDNGNDTDEWALENGFVSIVPVQFDLTAHNAIAYLNQWNLKHAD
jgi:hypothetical protein